MVNRGGSGRTAKLRFSLLRIRVPKTRGSLCFLKRSRSVDSCISVAERPLDSTGWGSAIGPGKTGNLQRLYRPVNAKYTYLFRRAVSAGEARPASLTPRAISSLSARKSLAKDEGAPRRPLPPPISSPSTNRPRAKYRCPRAPTSQSPPGPGQRCSRSYGRSTE